MKLKNLLFGLTIVLSIASCSKKKDAKPTPDPVTPPVVIPTPPTRTPWVAGTFKIVAYMPSYREPAMVDDSKYKMITHLLYAFINPNPNGDGSLNAVLEPARFATVIAKAKSFGVKTGISVSGNKTIFAAFAASATARTRFVTQLLAFVKTNNLDGADIDWEYPTSADASAANFVLLMKELSEAFKPEGKFLSAAVTPGVYAGGVRDGMRPEVFQYIDFLNLMQYDGPNYDAAEPLNHASMKLTQKSLEVYLTDKGLPKEKAILGIPLYGEDATGASKGYRDIEAAGVNVYLNVGKVGGVDYGYNGIQLIWQKAQLAKETCNGIMFWEFSHDSNSSKSLIRAANEQLGRPF
jgi:GH18 family chitinase